MAACFLRGSSKTTVGLSGRLLPTHPLLLYQLPAIRLCVFLGTNFHPKTTEFFLKCRVLSELIRQQPACKDNTRYQGFLGLSLFGLFSKHLTDAESCLETLGLVDPPCFSLRLWYQNALRLIWKEKKKTKPKRSDGAGELLVFTEGSGKGGQRELDTEGGSGICCFDVSTWKIFPPNRV